MRRCVVRVWTSLARFYDKGSLCLGSGGLTVIRLRGEIRGKSENVWRVYCADEELKSL